MSPYVTQMLIERSVGLLSAYSLRARGQVKDIKHALDFALMTIENEIATSRADAADTSTPLLA